MYNGIILDDEADFVEELQEYLTLRGLPCIGMTEPLRARDYLRSVDHDVPFVILDLKMPGFTGRDIVMFIQELISECTRLALVSGDRESIVALGITRSCSTRLFHKPIDPEILVDYLRSGAAA
jgi:DNA-binding response OmpR family regulator